MTETQKQTPGKTPGKIPGKTPDNESSEQTVRGSRRKMTGRIVSDTAKPGRAKKTVTVVVERRFRDPVYGKYVKSRAKHHAHDEKEEYRQNDLVEITESRPLSRTKRWIVTRLIVRPEEV